MKVQIEALRWNYERISTKDCAEPKEICTGTSIEATVIYPTTEKTSRTIFRGTVIHADRICDIGEAQKIVESIINKK